MRSRITELEQQDAAVRVSELREESESWRLRCTDLESRLQEEQAVNKRLVVKKKKETDELQLRINGFAVIERNLNAQIKTYKDQLEAAVAKLSKYGVFLAVQMLSSYFSPGDGINFLCVAPEAESRPTSATRRHCRRRFHGRAQVHLLLGVHCCLEELFGGF